MCLGTKANCVCLRGVFASPGMVLSVLVVLLLTVFYELLKVWRVWLGSHSKLAQPQSRYATQMSHSSDRSSVLGGGASESSLFPIEPHPPAASTRKRSVNFLTFFNSNFFFGTGLNGHRESTGKQHLYFCGFFIVTSLCLLNK